jgi:hypothetical protein
MELPFQLFPLGDCNGGPEEGYQERECPEVEWSINILCHLHGRLLSAVEIVDEAIVDERTADEVGADFGHSAQDGPTKPLSQLGGPDAGGFLPLPVEHFSVGAPLVGDRGFDQRVHVGVAGLNEGSGARLDQAEVEPVGLGESNGGRVGVELARVNVEAVARKGVEEEEGVVGRLAREDAFGEVGDSGGGVAVGALVDLDHEPGKFLGVGGEFFLCKRRWKGGGGVEGVGGNTSARGLTILVQLLGARWGCP